MQILAIVFALFIASGSTALGSEEVTIRSGSVNLAGTFDAAPGAGNHPAIVLLAGSGKIPRDNVPFRALEALFTQAGFSVLAYDKRGSGQSGGAWDDNEPLSVLAGDGIAAIDYLKNRSDVNAKQIGVWGISQGAWVGPLMATMSADVSFVISVSGPGMSIAEQAIYLRGTQMLSQGYSAQDVAEETAYRRVLWAYYGTGLGRQAAQAALDLAKTRPWFRKLALSPVLTTPEGLDPSERTFMQQAAQYDPLAVAQRVKVPVLSIFGEKDSIAPASLSIQNLIQAYARGGNRDATFLLFPNAGHGLQIVTAPVECHECAERQMMRTRRWDVAPGFFTAMTDWLRLALRK